MLIAAFSVANLDLISVYVLHHAGDKIEKNEMGWACGACG